MSELMLLVNIVTIVLLIAGLWYSMRLSKRIDIFLKSREDLSALFRMFDETIAQAQKHTKRLGDEAADVSKELQRSGDEARLLLQDLRQTCVRAEKIYDKAERGLLQLSRGGGQGNVPKPAAAVEPPPARKDTVPVPAPPEERLRKEQMLEKMLKKASLLKKKNAEALAQAPANVPPKKTETMPALPEFNLDDNAADDIEDAGEAIKRALNALGLEGEPKKKRKK